MFEPEGVPEAGRGVVVGAPARKAGSGSRTGRCSALSPAWARCWSIHCAETSGSLAAAASASAGLRRKHGWRPKARYPVPVIARFCEIHHVIVRLCGRDHEDVVITQSSALCVITRSNHAKERFRGSDHAGHAIMRFFGCGSGKGTARQGKKWPAILRPIRHGSFSPSYAAAAAESATAAVTAARPEWVRSPRPRRPALPHQTSPTRTPTRTMLFVACTAFPPSLPHLGRPGKESG